MGVDTFDLAELARYLRRDARELEKLASRGQLPGRRIGGDWRFHRAEIHQWLDQEMSGLTDRQLEGFESGMQDSGATMTADLLVTPLLSAETIEIPMDARTVPGILRALVDRANATWKVYMPAEVLAAVRDREEMCSTALPGGVAVPHPRSPMPQAIEDSLLAFGRAAQSIPFGGPRGQLTDLFFLILCTDERMHLRVLARLSRMFHREGFLEQLRAAENPTAALALIEQTEREIVG